MDKRFFEKCCHFSIRKFAIGAASVMIGASIFGLQVAQAAETETTSPSEETIHQVQPLDKLPDEVAAAIAKAEQNGPQDSATGEVNDAVEPAKPVTEEKMTEATSPKEEKEAEVVSPKKDKVEKNEKPAAEVNEKEPTVAEVSTEKPAVREEHTDTPNQNKPVTDDKSKEEKASASESPQVTKEKEKEDQLLQERKQNFNKDWYFKLNAQGDFSKKDVDVHDWSKLNLPHDWSIYFDFDHKSPARNEGGQLNGGTAWYRKTFTVDEAAKDKDVRINFDGVYMDSKVYVNGKFVGHYPSGYNHFSYDITEFLNKDGSENTIAVQVTNKQPSSRWYSGSGIYRDVTLSYRDKVQVAENGNHITTPKLAEQKDGNVETQIQSKIKNTAKTLAKVFVEQQIFTKEGKAVSDLVRSVTKSLAGNETADFKQTILVNKPTLWTIKSYHPQLYVLKTKVYNEGQLVDVTEDTFGYRYFNWTAKEGFSLNGERMKFHGVSIHHDNGALGAEENYKATYRKLKLLKDMGVNSIRTTHNPASPQLLDAAASLGLLVQEEAFDTWYRGKKTYDYGRFFDQDATHPEAKKGEKWSDFDLRTMVERDKNNPSIIMWSLGNEVDEADGGKRSLETAKRLKAVIKAIDKERYVTMGENKFSRASTGLFLELAAIMDVVGMNYGERNYDAVRKAHPDWLIYGSETSSATRTRDSYFDPAHLLWHDNRPNRHYEQSDYGNDRVAWGRTATESWTFDRDRAGYAGQFIWTGFDYIGEPTPWHNQDNTPVKSSYFGIIDTAGLPKNDFYLYRSEWYSAKEKPTVRIMPHWNWTEETLKERNMLVNGKVPVRTFSNAASVELFLNNESLGKKEFVKKTTEDGRPYHEGAKPSELYLEWLVDYKPGTLTAIARDENGKEIARDSVTTAGEPARVRLTKEEHVITADGKDLSYIHYEIVDEDGNVVPTANNLVHFNLHGQGQIVGVDNGEQASRERYKAQKDGTWQRKAFNGKGVVIVKSTEKEGKFTLYADSAGLASDQATVTTVSGKKENRHFVAYAPVKARTDVSEDPKLPETVTAIYSDGSVEEKAVTWDIPEDLLSSAGEKKVLGSVEGLEAKAEALVKVVALDKWLPKVATVPVGTAAEDLDKTVTAVLSDGNLVDANVVSWTLKDPSALTKEGGRTEATGKLEGNDYEVTATFIASDQETESTVTGLTVGDKSLENFEPGKTYYRVSLPYTAKIPNVGAQTTGYQVTVQQASAANDYQASVFLSDQKGDLVQTYLIQFVKEAPALTRLEVSVEGKENATEDQVLPYHVIGHYEDGSQTEFSASDIHLEAKSADGGHLEVNGQNLLLYKKGSVTLTPRIDNQTDKTQSVATELVIKENTVDKKIVKLHPVSISTDINQQPNLPDQIGAEFDKGLPRKVAVTWDKVDAKELGYYHNFTLKGHVEGTDIEALANVTVEGLQVAEEISLTLPKGETVQLPANVRAYHSNGTTVYKDVLWDKVPENFSQTEGIYEIKGQLVGSHLTTKAHVRVSSQVVAGNNISKQWTGSQLPAAIVSNTGGDDSASTLNDLTVSRTNTDVKNRWTTWQTGTDNDWASILFGNSGDLTKRFVDNLSVDFYTDGAIGLPKEYVIEYYVGQEVPDLPNDVNHAQGDTKHPFNNAANWKAVENLHAPGQLSAGQTNHFTFDKVETYAVRMRMKKADGKAGVGLTEITILGSKVPSATSSEISIQVDGKKLEHFNPSKTDYYIPQTSKEITATASNNGLVTVVPATSEKGATRLILKAEDGTVLKEYRIFRDDEKESTQPVAAENSAQILNVGDQLQLPAEVTVYYPSQAGWVKANLAVQWDAVPEHATAQEGSFEVLGHVLGTDLTTKMQVTVFTKGNQVISENASNNATDSKAFASTTNDTQAASRDKIFYINDGHFNEDGRWTNWSRTPKDQETSVGILFKKNGQITPQSVGKVAIQFFKDSGTDAPAKMVLERYVGPAYTEPSTISRYEENADHPFNKAENWQEIPYKASGEIVAGKPIEFTFDPIETSAIRARMTRKSTTNGLAMVEFSAYSPAKARDEETPSVSISVAGKALENFDPEVSDYTVSLNGTKPQVTAQASGHGVTTVVESSQDNLPTLVRLLAKDGSLVKEYRIHFKPSHRVVPEEGDQSPVLERPSLEVVKTPILFKEIIRENNDLAQDERRVISEGKNGERVDYVEVLGSNRTTVHTDTTEAQDRIVEVKVKPVITTSKGDEPAPVVEVPEFEGGVNAAEAAKHELPEYTDAIGTAGDEPAPVVEIPEFEGGVNAVEDAKHELPEYTEAIGTVGDEPAPVVEVPEFEGGVNAVEAAKNELPEYTDAIGTVGDNPAPVVEVPEFEGGVNAAEAAKHELPEYTEAIGTAGDEPAPVVEIPEFEGGVNAVEAAKNELPEYTEAVGTVGEDPAPVVEIPEFKGGANAVEAAKNELPEYTEAIGTVGDEPAPVVEVPEFEGGVNAVEAAKNELPEYTEAIGTVGNEPAPVVEVPEFEGGVNAVEAAKNELPEYTEAIGTVGDEPAPVVEIPEFDGGVNAVEAAKHELPEYTEAIGTVGDEPAPVVEVPEFTGSVNAVEAAKNELPEYTEAIGTVGDEPAPVVEIPEFDGGVNAVEAAKNELPEYTEAIGTVGDEPAPSVEKPTAEVQILSDKETGVLVAGLSQDLDANLKLQVQKVLRQELAGKQYDAYQVKLLDKDNQMVDPKGAVLVRLPVKGQVQGVYHMSLDQGLQVQKVTLVGDTVEFVTKDLGLYAIVYKEQNQEPVESAHGLVAQGEVSGNNPGKANSARLPETGESRSDTAAFLASLSLVLSVALLTVKRKEK
ncbi:SIALI-17 repeat-containing surface protein [Streptococcus infantis]|uniref:SIALI-17 repeat-containing surface protein n=1 Tax=Streptococcus infantis TaxID=68892 RepID=UPI0039C43F9A